MGAIATVKIDLNKLDKARIYEGKNGAKWYEFSLMVNDKTSQYGDNIQATDTQSKEEREAKASKNFLGGGKVVWVGKEGISVAERTDGNNTSSKASNSNQSASDLPF